MLLLIVDDVLHTDCHDCERIKDKRKLQVVVSYHLHLCIWYCYRRIPIHHPVGKDVCVYVSPVYVSMYSIVYCVLMYVCSVHVFCPVCILLSCTHMGIPYTYALWLAT